MIIRIHDLRAQTVLGVYDWEKTAPREVVLNLELELADNRAGETDELSLTVDYAAVSRMILDDFAAMKTELIETLAHHVLTRIGERFPAVRRATVRIDKPGILPEARSVSVEDSRRFFTEL